MVHASKGKTPTLPWTLDLSSGKESMPRQCVRSQTPSLLPSLKKPKSLWSQLGLTTRLQRLRKPSTLMMMMNVHALLITLILIWSVSQFFRFHDFTNVVFRNCDTVCYPSIYLLETSHSVLLSLHAFSITIPDSTLAHHCHAFLGTFHCLMIA